MKEIMPMPLAMMMMTSPDMKKHNPFLLILLFVLAIPMQKATAQQNDFQCWPSVQLNLEVIKNLKLHVEEEIRFTENVSQIGRQINDLGISYRINKYLKTALYYRLEAKWKNPEEHAWRNGVYGDLSFRVEPGRFLLGYRLRVQSSRVELNDSEAQWFDGVRNRHKFCVEYDMKGIPLAPFAEGELFANLGGDDGSSLTDYRIWTGLRYSLNKKHEFTLKFGIDRELHVKDPLTAYIIAAGYALNLKLSSVE